MRRFLQLAFLLLLVQPAWAAVAFVSASNATASAISVSILINTVDGEDVVVVASIRTVTSTVSSVTDNPGGSTYALRAVLNDGTNERVEIWSARNVVASTSVTIHLSATSKIVGTAARYTGVSALGVTGTNSGSSTTPTIAVTTQDNNNFIVAGFASQGVATFAANVGNLRTSNQTSGAGGASNVGGAFNDNTASTPSSVTNTVTLSASQTWAAAALELRSTAGGAAPCPQTRLTLGVGC